MKGNLPGLRQRMRVSPFPACMSPCWTQNRCVFPTASRLRMPAELSLKQVRS